MDSKLKGTEKVRCAHWWERRSAGRRYVNARGQCTHETWHPSHYCKEHRFPWRWNDEKEANYLRLRDYMQSRQKEASHD